ncbi:uncharacterized protein [Anabrus simplex]|uniref:uncharacterized protein n=1 Tax=Anabrus simplex TaxID=316456 RepID=UPI0035A37C44
MTSTFHLRRLLYIFVFLGFVYVGIQIMRTQMGNGFVDDLDRNARLKQISILLDVSSGAVWKKLGAGGQACRHPHLEVQNSDIMRFIKDIGPIKCSNVQDWVEVDGSTLRITDHAREQFGNIECDFTDVLRGSDQNTHDGLTTKSHTEYNLEGSDFVKVYCKSEKGDTWHNIMAGIRHDQDVVDRTGWDKVPKDSLRLNVLMWGFDSLSRNMFIRKLPRSHHYMRETLKSIELQGYNIVGDGTPQALIPILTGKTELELPETRKRMGDKATFVNVYPFVWKEFQNNGYVTGYLEDCPSIGTFTYRLKGFDSPPTDHYMRTFYVEASKMYNKNKKFCLGSIPRHKVMMNYVHDFFKVYREKPKFLFAFHGELSHDSYNNVGSADLDLLEWLQTLNQEGHLNNTLLIIMSDHGHRFADIRNTQQGKQEERLPMFSFVFPPWFIRSFPQAVANFKRNIQRLTSPFDIHPTLQNVLHYQGVGKGDIRNRSISLFKEIPLERTCADAYIEPHWCACLDWQAVSLSDSMVQRAADAVVDFINKYTEESRELCHILHLNEVTWAAKLVPTQGLLRFLKNADKDGFVADLTARTGISQETYQLKLSTTPGNGLFEVSLRYDVNDKSFAIRISDISRINKYGSDAHCITNTQEQLRKYCYCKEPPPKEH